MKTGKVILLAAAMIYGQAVSGQFYTLTMDHPLTGKVTEEVGRKDLRIPDAEAVRHATDSLAREYASVSLPLDRILVTSNFGRRKDPFTGSDGEHSGVDLKARYDKVRAMTHAKVIVVTEDNISGKYIKLENDSVIISYCHLSRALVTEGDSVSAGQVVAVSGNTGRSTGPHLHVTCRLNGKLVDPMRMLTDIREKRENALDEMEKLAKTLKGYAKRTE